MYVDQNNGSVMFPYPLAEPRERLVQLGPWSALLVNDGDKPLNSCL